MRVSEIMTRDPKTARLDSTLEEIAALMKDEDVGAIPIVDDDKELVGIVTDRDIVIRCVAEGKEASDTTAEDILSEDLTTIEPDADVEEAARLMAQKQIRRLPVVQDGGLIGMVSIGDISVKHEDDQAAGETLQQISQGVKQSGRRKKAPISARGEREERSTGNRQMGGTRAESALAREFEENEDFDLEFSDEEEDAIPAAPARGGRQASNLKSGGGRHESSVRGRDTSISRRQPNPATLPNAKAQHNAKNMPAVESTRSQSESRSGTRSQQGIANRNAEEESRRQGRVVSIRDDAKAGSSKRAANRRKMG
jgi:CBS domain-containing protein